MESLSETDWDVVISGTGLQQSILALALSRSDKKIIHVDAEGCYGGSEAAFTLREADEWAEKHANGSLDAVFSAAEVTRSGELTSTRAYSLALAPQLIHARSDLLTKLVSSKAFRQIEFLAVGSFYIYQQSSDAADRPTLSRIPSTREDVFSNTAIPVRAKRSLMKFLKFVLDYQAEPQIELWQARADEPLDSFLASEFKLDESLRSYVITLTLSLDGSISVRDGLAAISRHLSSMGVFGAGFAAVYPKWGGLSEVAQVGCRACAVGGAVYMLGTGIKDVQRVADAGADSPSLQISLSDDNAIRAKSLFKGAESASNDDLKLSRLTAVVGAPLPSVFEVVVEGAPTPSVGVVAFPAGSIQSEGVASEFPIYAMVHSSDAGECPNGQCVVYLSTVASPASKSLLSSALSSLLTATAGDAVPATVLYQLYYEQRGAKAASLDTEGGNIATFGLPLLDLAFNDSTLDPVRQAWDMAMGQEANAEGVEYLVFDDREGVVDDDDVFE